MYIYQVYDKIIVLSFFFYFNFNENYTTILSHVIQLLYFAYPFVLIDMDVILLSTTIANQTFISLTVVNYMDPPMLLGSILYYIIIYIQMSFILSNWVFFSFSFLINVHIYHSLVSSNWDSLSVT